MKTLEFNATLIACVVSLAFAPLSRAGSAVELDPGVLVESGANRAFVANPTGRVQAIALSDGKVHWLSDHSGLPLAMTDQGLLVLGQSPPAAGGRLLLLDPDNGNFEGTIAFDLPDGIRATASPQPQRRFSVQSLPLANGVRLYWQFQERALRGALLSEDENSGEFKQASGVIEVDAESRLARSLPLTGRDAAPVRIANLTDPDRLVGITGAQFRAADDQHILTSSAVDDPLFGTVWRWNIHSRSSGASIGSVQSPHSMAPFMVDDGLLLARIEPYAYRLESGQYQVYVTRLAAFDLNDGSERWSVDVQDLSFRGVLPP